VTINSFLSRDSPYVSWNYLLEYFYRSCPTKVEIADAHIYSFKNVWADATVFLADT